MSRSTTYPLKNLKSFLSSDFFKIMKNKLTKRQTAVINSFYILKYNT